MSSKAAARYAKSLIDLAKEQKALELVMNDMVFFEKVVNDNSQLGAILKNPIVPLDKKQGIVFALTEKNVHKITLSFFKLVITKGRSALLFDIAKQFIQQYQDFMGIVTAEVSSAIALTEANKKEISTLIQKELGANKVVLIEKTNPELIGGFVLKVNDSQFDASILGSLNKLKKEFAQGVA